MAGVLIMSDADDAERPLAVGGELYGGGFPFLHGILDVITFDDEGMLRSVNTVKIQGHLLSVLNVDRPRIEPVYLVFLTLFGFAFEFDDCDVVFRGTRRR